MCYTVHMAQKNRQIPDDFIGQRIQRMRQAAGISQTQLARLIGITQGTLSQLERGFTAQPSEVQLRRLCEVLRTDPNTLYGFTMVRPPEAPSDD